jgi:hypothetical protein
MSYLQLLFLFASEHAGCAPVPMVTGENETPWDFGVTPRIHAQDPGGLILADLGTRPEPILPSCPTLVIDHHVPIGEPQGAITIRTACSGLPPSA